MLWHLADGDDADQLADLANATGRSQLTTAEAERFLEYWSVEIGVDDHGVAAAVAVLPPLDAETHRAYGAWWDRRPDAALHVPILVQRTVDVARRTPAATLQFSLPTGDRDRTTGVVACGFRAVFPIWTMSHDQKTWPSCAYSLPSGLRMESWTEQLIDSFRAAYIDSYRDQRIVEPQGARRWRSILESEAFSTTLSVLAVTPDDHVAAFVLAFQEGNHIELGPIGTVRSWRGRGVSTALLEKVLVDCRESQIEKVSLTVDGDSPTGAHRLYLNHGFSIIETLTAYHLALRPPG